MKAPSGHTGEKRDLPLLNMKEAEEQRKACFAKAWQQHNDRLVREAAQSANKKKEGPRPTISKPGCSMHARAFDAPRP